MNRLVCGRIAVAVSVPPGSPSTYGGAVAEMENAGGGGWDASGRCGGRHMGPPGTDSRRTAGTTRGQVRGSGCRCSTRRGRLLFLQEAFTERLLSAPLTFGWIKKRSAEFANTMTSTLWRAVESAEEPAFGLVSQHPRDALGETPLQYFVRSRSFAQHFLGSPQAKSSAACAGFISEGAVQSARMSLSFGMLQAASIGSLSRRFRSGHEALTARHGGTPGAADDRL